jgi:hypothetical protein
MAARSSNGLYPLDVPIAQLGLLPAEASLLTEDASKLTKGNLLILQDIGRQYQAEGEDKVLEVFNQRTDLTLTVGDLSSLEHAFSNMNYRMQMFETAESVSCCCCTCCPCCSSSATVVIEARV